MPFCSRPKQLASVRVLALFLMLILLGQVLCSRLLAVELPLLTYGPAFAIELEPPSARLNKHFREALITLRKSNTEMEIYDTTIKFAAAERATLEKLLRARGYYQAKVDFLIQADTIVYRASSGPLYHIRQVDLAIPEGVSWPSDTDLGVNSGAPLDAQAVLDGLRRFKQQLEQHNCLLDIDTDYRVLLDNEQYQADLEYVLQPSSQVVFDDLVLSGLTSVEEEFLQRKIKIVSGACFSRKELDRARLALLQSNLIAAVNQTVSDPEDGAVDVEFELTERNHRTVKTGIGYSTDERTIVSLGWEHRNLLGAGQKFSLDTRLSKVLQSVDGRLTLPELGRSDQTLELYGQLAREVRDTYLSKMIIGGAVMTRALTKDWSASAGLRLKLYTLVDQGDQEGYTLVSTPFSLSWNTTEDILDPRQGWILTGQVIPYTDLLNVGTRFVKTIGSGSAYYTSDWFYGTPTLAVKGSIGTLTGSALTQVPADERYFSGGGGSVRGYPYQSLSNYHEGDPEGGRSFIETSFETRFHHADNWGSALFVDGGFSEASSTPRWTNALLWSAGLGLRYFTAATPIRFDIAWPLDRRPGIDDAFQLYLSLGQAF